MKKNIQPIELRQFYKTTKKIFSNLWVEVRESFLLTAAFVITAIVIFISYCVLDTYINQFDDGTHSTKPETWGQFGDFIGGTLNPVIGLATLLMLAINVLLQRKQLKHAQDESKATQRSAAKQSFEQSFFSLLSNYRELLDYISAEDKTESSKKYRGRQALEYLWDENIQWEHIIEQATGEDQAEDIKKQILSDPDDFDDHTATVLREKIRYQYARVLINDSSNILPLLKSIGLTLEWLDSHHERLPDETRRYTSIFLRSLSTTELLFIFFHSLAANDTPKETLDIFIKYSIFSSMKYIEKSSHKHNVYTFSRKYGVGPDKKKFPIEAFKLPDDKKDRTIF